MVTVSSSTSENPDSDSVHACAVLFVLEELSAVCLVSVTNPVRPIRFRIMVVNRQKKWTLKLLSLVSPDTFARGICASNRHRRLIMLHLTDDRRPGRKGKHDSTPCVAYWLQALSPSTNCTNGSNASRASPGFASLTLCSKLRLKINRARISGRIWRDARPRPWSPNSPGSLPLSQHAHNALTLKKAKRGGRVPAVI